MMTKTIISIFLVILSLFSVVLTEVFAAASLSLSPGKTNPAQGQSFSVSVNINTGGEAVNAAEITLTFPADKLKATSISGGSFDVKAESTIGSGIVRIGRGKLPPAIVGSAKVASVSFTTLSAGPATISGSGSVLRESDSANVLSGGASTVINIGPPAAAEAAPSGQTAQQPSGSAQTSAVAPVISNVEVMNLGVATATIRWKTDKAAASHVEYGLALNRQDTDYRYMFEASSETLVTEHEINLTPKTLVAGYLYHFKVSSEAPDGASATSEDNSFNLPGYPLTIIVKNQEGKAVGGAIVKLTNIGVEGLTDTTGTIVFNDLPSGNLLILVESNGQIKQDQVQNLPDKNEKTIVIEQKVSGFSFMWLIAILVLVIASLITIMGVSKWKKRANTDSTLP